MDTEGRSIHIGLWLGLGSLFLMGIGILYYDTSEDFDEDLNTRFSRSQYMMHVTENPMDDEPGPMTENWKLSDDDEHRNTIFNRILKGQEEGRILYEDDYIGAVSAEPKRAPVHFIVFPKKTVTSLSMTLALDNGELLIGRIYKIIEKLAKSNNIVDTGYRVVMNNGPDADQTIQHLHFHVFGGQSMGWPPFPVRTISNKSQNDYDYENYDIDEVISEYDKENQSQLIQKMNDDLNEDEKLVEKLHEDMAYAQHVLQDDDDVPDSDI